MEEINNKYMEDDFIAAGTSVKELIETAKCVDEHTGVRQCNFSDGTIWHYSGYKNSVLNFAVFDPDNPIQRVESEGHFFFRFRRNKYVSTKDFINYGVFCILQDMQRGKNRTVFELKSSFPENDNGILFVSDIAKKTMLPRLTNNRLNIAEDFVERDLLLTRLIGTSWDDVIKYVVYRRSGPFKKAIAFFGKNPKRIAFQDVALAAKTYHKRMKCEKWEITNRFGLRASFRMEELNEQVQKIFPGLTYRPIITMITCDSGHITNKVMLGWCRNSCKEFTPFYTHDFMVEEDEDTILAYQQCIDQCVNAILQDAERMLVMSQNLLNETEEDYDRAVLTMAKVCLTDVNAGAKAKSTLIQRSQERDFAKTQFEMLEMLMDVVEAGNFANSSPYADTRIRELGIRHLFEKDF